MIALKRPICPNPAALENRIYDDSVNKDALRQSTAGKCMYCESKIEHIASAHIKHIKPKAKDKFPELTYVWENLGFSCPRCNTNKGDKYDVETPFINPYQDEPSDHIVFIGYYLSAKQGSERGEYTIKEIKLNRADLVERRKERLEKVNSMIKAAFRTSNALLRKQAIEEIKNEASEDKEYSALIKSLLVIQGVL